ncbi:MAG TPA: biotin--[acetyl-CoA-carboxylase] ligase [Blastocatellia bacterium]|nr:biotin--[acetyl-CoA-carboxylase] ligase [Blastocatellia bacterium]
MAKLGSEVLHFDSLPSTNDRARDMALAGSAEGTAIVAARQTSGRGRMGRSWSSPAGEGLYLSVILRPQVRPAEAQVITLAAAVAVCETLAEDFGARADIKWPNDVLVGGRKICGILVESAIEGDFVQYAILGIGVNLRQTGFPEEIRSTATSLLIETGKSVPPDEVLEPLFERLDLRYRQSLEDPGAVVRRWEELSSCARGCRVRVTSFDSIIEGTTRGLSEGGGLLIEVSDGETREIVSGEVSLTMA